MQVVDKYGNTFGQGHLVITTKSGKSKLPVVTVAWGNITGVLSDQSDLQKELDFKVPTSRILEINGVAYDLSEDRSWTISTGITVNTTPITGGTSGRLLFDNAGTVGETGGVSWDSTTATLSLFNSPFVSQAGNLSANTSFSITGTASSNYTISSSRQFIFNTGQSMYFNTDTDGGSALDRAWYFAGARTGMTGGRTYGALTVDSSGFPSFILYNNDNGARILLNSNAASYFNGGNLLVGTTTDAGFRFDVAGTIRSQGSLFISNPSFTMGGSITHSANATLSIVGGPAGESIVIGPSNRIFINAGQSRFPVGSVQIAGTLSVGEANTTAATMLWITGGITASSSIARGISLITALTQSAANDVLTAVNIAPTFTVNSALFHDVYWARITGSYAPAAFTANNNATTIDLNNSFTNTNNAIGIRIRHTYSNVQNGYGILIESPSFIGIAQTSLTSINFLAGTTVIGSSVAPAAGYTLHVTNNTNGAIKVGSASQANEHLVISHSQAGNTFSSIRNTYAVAGAQMLIDVAAQGNLRLFGTGNVAINNSTDAGFKLDVNGTARVQGNTTVTGTIGIGSGSSFLSLSGAANNNVIQGTQTIEYRSGGGTLNRAYHNFTNSLSFTPTADFIPHVNMAATFAPTSGTGTYAQLYLYPTINQTGGANGITRGLYIQPTLTAAADFRAIETTAGNVIFNGGNVGIGTSSPLDFNLVVQGVQQIRASASSFGGLRLDATSIRRRDTGTFSLGTNDSSTAINMFAPTNNVGINTSIDAGYKLDINGTVRSKSDLYVGYDSIAAGSTYIQINPDKFNSKIIFNDFDGGTGTRGGILEMSTYKSRLTYGSYNWFYIGDSINPFMFYIAPSTGNFILTRQNTQPTDAGYKLDVNGSTRIVSALTLGGVVLSLNSQGGGTINSANSAGNNTGPWINLNGPAYFNPSTGNNGLLNLGGQYYVQSGNSNFNHLGLSPIINASGTYSGTIRGFYYNPTLTSVTGVTHRAIETTSGDVIFNGGNVGIGTTIPSGLLHTSQSAGNSTSISTIAGTNYQYLLQNKTDLAGTYVGIGFMNPFDTQGFIGCNQVGTGWGAGGEIIFATRPAGGGTVMSERMRIFNNGNVGINTTTNAGYTLDINGTVRVKANSLTLSASGLSTPPANYIGINFDETPNHHQLWYAINSKKDISGIGTSYDRIIFPTMGSDNSTWQFNALGTYSRIQISARNNASGNYLDLTNSSISLSGPWTVVSIDRGNRKLVFGNMSTDVHHLSVYDIVIKGAQPFEGNYGNSNGGNVYLVGGTPSTTPAGNYGNVILAHDSTAARGNVLVGTSTNVPSAVVNVNSTTQGFLPPRMTNAQMLAIGTPAEGLMVYDTTNRKLCCYDGATWQPLF
jgi:hypothetical protein